MSANRFSRLEHPPADVEQAPSLPSDPKVRAEILAGIQQGIAEADAGLSIPWKVVKAEIEALITARRKKNS